MSTPFKQKESDARNSTSGADFLRPLLLGIGILACGIILTILLKPLGGPPLAQEAMSQDVTYHSDIVPILQKHCQTCHRPNRIGPIPLMSYENVADIAPLIAEVTKLRTMPPWGAVENYGEFKNKRVMTQAEIDTIARWVEQGTPAGNPSDEPPPVDFPDDWLLGDPDVVVDPGGDFKVRGRGRDFFRSFVLPFSPEEDMWISAIEFIPDAKEVVHHVGFYLDIEGISLKLDRESPGLGFSGTMGFDYDRIIDLWTPGGTPHVLEPGLGWLMPAGSHIVMDIHYAPDGTTRTDRSQVGIYFAKERVKKEVYLGVAGNTTFEIPAGAENYSIDAKKTIRSDIHILSCWPHMHYLGKEMKVFARLPDGEIEPIVWVPKYDFHWQQIYELAEPLSLPKGSQINLVAVYDNSTNNPENPYKKPRDIRFGQRANDEMCYFYYYYTKDEE
jgi:hypothetical protein